MLVDINGVKVTPLKKLKMIEVTFHMMKADTNIFEKFGEIYFSLQI